MAGLKKRKKEKGVGPNVVLVIFLVFFVLISIGLGIWGYYGYSGQTELISKRFAADSNLKSEKLAVDYYRTLYRDLRLALGDKLDEAAEKQEFDAIFKELVRDDFGPFKIFNDKEAARKLREELKQRLGNEDGLYKSNFKTELDNALTKLKDLDTKANKEVEKHAKTKALFDDLKKKQDEYYETASTKSDVSNKAILAEYKKRSEEFKASTAMVQELNAKLKEKESELSDIKGDHENEIRKLNLAIKTMRETNLKLAAEGVAGAANVLPRGDTQPNILDISTGKPLWDTPVGKITHVDLEKLRVVVNLGRDHNVMTGLTFNIFAANKAGRAEGWMRGGIEIIRVVDGGTSLARITSLYDAERNEIPLNAQTLGRLFRESEAPIRDGDLLFNMFWGTRVAIAGYVSVTGESSDNPKEQQRQLNDLIYFLKLAGMTVDAWVDLESGEIKGRMTSKTRYLIRGEDLATADKAPVGKPAEEGAEDKKEPAKPAQPQVNVERNEQINKASFVLRNEARDRGLLIISAENFAMAIGLRRARSTGNVQMAAFRPPSLPFAGAVDAGPARPPMDAEKPAAPAEEKKGMDDEKKPAEKKGMDDEKKPAEKKAVDDEKKPAEKKVDEEKKADDDKKPAAANKEIMDAKAAMQGDWVAKSIEKDGKPLPAEILKLMSFTFDGDKAIARIGPAGAEMVDNSTYTIDPSKAPKQIVMTDKDKKVSLGIYELDKDELKISFRDPASDKGVPNVFAAAAGSEQVYMVLTRKK